MVIKRITIFLITSIVTACHLSAKENKTPDYTEYAMEIISSFAKQVKKEYGLDCGACGGGMPYDVEEIAVDFEAVKKTTIEEARILEVQLTEKLTQMINADEKIRPFLREYPFPTSRAQVSISFYDRKGRRFLDGKVSHVFHVKERIYYRAEDPQNPYVPIKLSDEPYEEARKIVLGENPTPSAASKDP